MYFRVNPSPMVKNPTLGRVISYVYPKVYFLGLNTVAEPEGLRCRVDAYTRQIVSLPLAKEQRTASGSTPFAEAAAIVSAISLD